MSWENLILLLGGLVLFVIENLPRPPSHSVSSPLECCHSIHVEYSD